MRLILRLLGTWFIGMAVILIIIDGTKTLAASSLVTTSLGETWTSLSGASLEQVKSFIETRFFGAVLEPALDVVLGWPGFVALGLPGILLALAGRSRRSRHFIRQDQF